MICGRFRRAWHGYMRALDRAFVLGSLHRRCRASGRAPRAALEAWMLHKRSPGQRHWQCGCCPEAVRVKPDTAWWKPSQRWAERRRDIIEYLRALDR